MTKPVAIITGGSRGIGAAIAQKLAHDGFDIAISFARSATQANEICQKIEALGCKALSIQADGSTVEGNKKVISETVKHFGRVDVLVCNAGMFSYKNIDQVSVDDINDMLNLNLRSVMVEVSEAVRHLPSGGRIILIGSTFAGRAPFAGISLYSAAKAGLRGFTKGVARDLGQKAITINVIEPGPINTDMNPADGEAFDLISSFTATKNYGQVDDIARTVSFLASSESGNITGAAIAVDGGLQA